MRKYICIGVAALFFFWGGYYGMLDWQDGHYLSAISFALAGFAVAVTVAIAATDFETSIFFSKYTAGILVLFSFLSAFSDSPAANTEINCWKEMTLSRLLALSFGQTIGSVDPTYESEQAAVVIISHNLCDFDGTGSAQSLVFEVYKGLYWKTSHSIVFRFFNDSTLPLDECLNALQSLNDAQPGVLPESILDTTVLPRRC